MKILTFLSLLAVCGLALRLTSPAQTLSVSSLVPAGNQLTIIVKHTVCSNSSQKSGSANIEARATAFDPAPLEDWSAPDSARCMGR